MKKNVIFSLFLSLMIISISGCSTEQSHLENRVVIGIRSDVTTFNPLFTTNQTEGNVSELMYLGLVGHDWDKENSKLTDFPLLAENWKWTDDKSSITFKLRNNVYWSDSVKFTADDVIYSFDLYSDPKVESRFFGIFDHYFLNEDASIDLEKSFEKISDYEIKFNFKPGVVATLYDTDMPILPKHIFENMKREDIATSDANFKPVGTGPYKLSSWERNQSIKLTLRKDSFLANEKSIGEMIFKIIPDYNSALTQLKQGQVDLLENIQTEDISDLEKNEDLNIVPRKGRNYDYVGWNNIDGKKFREKGAIVPNEYFGSAKVRKALTYAINRESILKEFLHNYGQIAVSPVAPIFKDAINKDMKPTPYNPEKARELLDEEGWKDTNNNGIRDKNGKEFSFVLNIPGGNKLRENAGVVIQNNLKSVGIDAKIEKVEFSVFGRKLFGKEMNAWIAGWAVPIPMDLEPFWHSNLQQNFPNVVSYQNAEADKLIEKMKMRVSPEELNDLYKKFQVIINKDQPVTFLYWMDDMVAYNNRIKNIDINPLGAIQFCWNWSISNN